MHTRLGLFMGLAVIFFVALFARTEHLSRETGFHFL
jgi:hypothetical protein